MPTSLDSTSCEQASRAAAAAESKLTLNGLARQRLAAGVDLYVECEREFADPTSVRPRWIRVRVASSKVDANARRPGAPGLPLLEIDTGHRSGPKWTLLTPAHTAMTTDMLAITSMDFRRLYAALGAPAAPGASCGASCFWYADALAYARSGTVAALQSLEAECPDLVARQRAIDMAAVVADRASESVQASERSPGRARRV